MHSDMSTEVFLSKEERLSIVKGLLKTIVEAVSDETKEDRDNIISSSLEELAVHIEAGGNDMNFNDREKNVLSAIRNRGLSSKLKIADLSAQLLGAINQEKRFPSQWKEYKDLVKEVFLDQLINYLNSFFNNDEIINLFNTKELISGFTLHEESNIDPDILKLCYGIDLCISEILEPGATIDRSRLEIQRRMAILMRDNLGTNLS